MFFTEEKLAARIGELSEYRYRESLNLDPLLYQFDETGEVGMYPPVSGQWKTVELGHSWQGRDLYIWVAADVEIPKNWQGKKVLGRFDFGRTGGGGNSGFESLLFVNGKPYQGVDSNHQEVFFPNELVGTTVQLRFRLWSGLEGGGKPRLQEIKLKRAQLCWLDEAADDLYYTAKAALLTVKELSPEQPVRPLLVNALDRAFLAIDWSKPGDENFYASVAEARDILKREIAKIEKSHPVTVRCIGHTHIDVAWLWRLKHTREKAARSFSTVLRLMELYPEYVFLQTQPQLYDFIKSDYPEIYEQIRRRVSEGRWEAEGGMWLEADCNITSGESLTRQILLGTRFLRDEFGVECKYLWLPDVFGYSWALPQILKKSGIDTFMTTKISWNQYNRMPHDTFWWRGIDGTEVLTHFITTPTSNDAWFYTYNGEVTPASVLGIWKTYRDKAINQNLLLSYGYGDGGGGVNREMLEMRRRLETMPGLPQVETGRADEYFAKLHETVENTDQYVHTWDGELYLEYHRGTYTSQARNKRMNRKLELLYRETEWLNVLRSLETTDWSQYPQQQMNEGWKIILRNQFHDIIPGSSIREVYEDSLAEYKVAEEIARKEWDVSAKTLVTSQGDYTYTVFNSAPWVRTDLVEIPVASGMEKGVWVNCDGKELLSARTEGAWLVRVEDIPSMGFASIEFKPEGGTKDEQSEDLFAAAPHKITTPFYEISWNEQGQLTRLYDRENDREVLAPGARGNVFQIFEDKPMRHEAWDIDIFYQQKMQEVTNLVSAEVVEVNELRAVIHFVWEYKDSKISQDMIVYSDSPRIDFKTVVDWHQRRQLLKVAFPVNVRATSATYDIQYGNVQRPTHWNTSWDQARFEVVGHQWADLSETGYGVSLLNDCKYGYDIKDNVMRLSLLKSAMHPDYDADQGEQVFTYSLLPHAGNWLDGYTVEEAWELNNPVSFVKGAPSQGKFSLFSTEAYNLMIDAVKKAEDENKVVLRLHEFAGDRGHVCISSDLPIKSWQECDLLERPTGPKLTDAHMHFELKPYEIKTFLVEFER